MNFLPSFYLLPELLDAYCYLKANKLQNFVKLPYFKASTGFGSSSLQTQISSLGFCFRFVNCISENQNTKLPIIFSNVKFGSLNYFPYLCNRFRNVNSYALQIDARNYERPNHFSNEANGNVAESFCFRNMHIRGCPLEHLQRKD